MKKIMNYPAYVDTLLGGYNGKGQKTWVIR